MVTENRKAIQERKIRRLVPFKVLVETRKEETFLLMKPEYKQAIDHMQITLSTCEYEFNSIHYVPIASVTLLVFA